MILTGKGWHYLAGKKLSALLRGIALNNNGGLYCLNCPRSFRTKTELESYKKVCENKKIFVILLCFQKTIKY